jgi:hypothetical protein
MHFTLRRGEVKECFRESWRSSEIELSLQVQAFPVHERRYLEHRHHGPSFRDVGMLTDDP